ncbi:bifunctional riboflavin kinase/FAD synthetase [Gorillibacterium timonense]|uniref:bifunctional riboflavin kinase/FAD synthetase n=1 Tax=Gorillibacterium timonense TaxID=1689269 RepID=UPI00071C3470|nr:bifunctional riboflavin kinase/FAD synthetase [Gorillibacterium timonense]
MHVIELNHLYQLPLDLASSPGLVLAIGDFDGVHQGHREVIRRATTRAEERKLSSAVMTFHPHPREILGMDKYRQILTPLPDKLELLDRLGLTYTFLVNFDKAFSELPPAEFVEKILVKLNLETVVVGFDFKFGRGGEGNPDSLANLAKGRFAVEVIRPFHADGQKVSSTLIREYLLAGDVGEANLLLDRPYTICGEVVTGAGRGRTIGFPTANVQPTQPYVIPANGVYAVRVQTDDGEFGGVMNIGVKPTFDVDEGRTLEVHLLDYSGSLYGQKVRVEFHSMLRPERKFASVDELVSQIARDAEEAKSRLAMI